MSGSTILIVEDSPVSLKLTASVLRSEGFRVQVASSAEQALTSLRSSKPDLVLVDLMLPGMSGLELTTWIKQDGRLKDVKVLALTACGMAGDEERARSAGCDGYLTKPIEKQTLLKQVRRYLGMEVEGVAPADPAPAAEVPSNVGPESSPQLSTLGIPESELEDLKRTFLADGVVQSRQLLASLDQGFDEKETALLSHRWAGSGGLLGFPKISDRAREVDVILRTPPWTATRLRAALTNLAEEFAEPAAAVAELQIPESIVQELQSKRVALVGLGDMEAERLCGALARVGAKPRLFEADYPPQAQAVCECNVVLIHVRPETMDTEWLAPDFVPPPGLPVVFIGTRERLFALNPAVQARAREFLIDGWQPEEALMRLSFALSRTAGAEPPAAAAAAASQSAAPVTAPRRAVAGPPEVLVADDDIAVRTVVCSALQSFGMHCLMAASGLEALEAVRLHRPHAAVLDVNMPGMDGFEVLATIRAENIPVRVILLTARQQDHDVLRGFSLGADDYVVKPFNPMELVARLKRLLVA
jgi:two-component system cell cycle response regulator DivK